METDLLIEAIKNFFVAFFITFTIGSMMIVALMFVAAITEIIESFWKYLRCRFF